MLIVTFLLYSPLFSGSSSFLLLFLSTALQGQDSSPPSVYNFSRVHTLFILSLKSSGSDLSRKNKLSYCIVIREIIHIKHSPCEHEHNKSSFKKLKHSAVTGRGIAYLLQKWPFYSSARFNQPSVSVISRKKPFCFLSFVWVRNVAAKSPEQLY